MPKIGIIGGSGLYDMSGLEPAGEEKIETPYGSPSACYRLYKLGRTDIAFLPRHGAGHSIAPHKINYRANIRGFKELGVERIIAVNATGTMEPGLPPGRLVLLSQVIDFTQGMRAHTYYEQGDVAHVDFTEPYCPELRGLLKEAFGRAGAPVADGATYVCVNGPRLESRAEIGFYKRSGGQLIGMTGMPEAALARELEVCYAGLAVATNYAAGIEEGNKLTTTEVLEAMARSAEKIKAALVEFFRLVPEERHCACKDALKDTRL
jgi:5'-methylthioadenosine phosphorylase